MNPPPKKGGKEERKNKGRKEWREGGEKIEASQL